MIFEFRNLGFHLPCFAASPKQLEYDRRNGFCISLQHAQDCAFVCVTSIDILGGEKSCVGKVRFILQQMTVGLYQSKTERRL